MQKFWAVVFVFLASSSLADAQDIGLPEELVQSMREAERLLLAAEQMLAQEAETFLLLDAELRNPLRNGAPRRIGGLYVQLQEQLKQILAADDNYDLARERSNQLSELLYAPFRDLHYTERYKADAQMFEFSMWSLEMSMRSSEFTMESLRHARALNAAYQLLGVAAMIAVGPDETRWDKVEACEEETDNIYQCALELIPGWPPESFRPQR